MVTIDQLSGIIYQSDEIVRRVGNGSLDPTAVKRALQDIIESKVPKVATRQPPTWWRTVEEQLEYAQLLWPDKVLPEPPRSYMSRMRSEVLLLHVPDTFDALWERVSAPKGYSKHRSEVVSAEERHLRLSPNKREYTEPVWLAFDPEHGNDERPDSLWGQTDIAASEVLSALIQFPEWPLAWYHGASAPNLSGYQFRGGFGFGWSHVLFIHLSKDLGQLELNCSTAQLKSDKWSSPTVRKC